MRRWLVVIVAVVIGAGVGSAVTSFLLREEPREEPQAGPSPPSSPGPPPSAADFQAVEQVVRDYLEAFRTGDFERRRELSTGELTSLADWQEILEEGGATTLDEMEIRHLEVMEVTGDTAYVELDATLTTTYVDPLSKGEEVSRRDLSGPVTLIREGSEWKIADYFRNERKQTDEIFTKLSGRSEKNGIVIEVEGADLRDNATLLVVTIRNTRADALQTLAASLVTETGQQIGNGYPESTSLAPRAEAEDVYYFGGGVSLKTRTLRFLPEFSTKTGFETIAFDIRVRLRD